MEYKDKRLKYNAKDYPAIEDLLIDAEKKYNKYLKSKTVSNHADFKQAIWNVRIGIKHLVVGDKITEEHANEMIDYYMGVLYD